MKNLTLMLLILLIAGCKPKNNITTYVGKDSTNTTVNTTTKVIDTNTTLGVMGLSLEFGVDSSGNVVIKNLKEQNEALNSKVKFYKNRLEIELSQKCKDRIKTVYKDSIVYVEKPNPLNVQAQKDIIALSMEKNAIQAKLDRKNEIPKWLWIAIAIFVLENIFIFYAKKFF